MNRATCIGLVVVLASFFPFNSAESAAQTQADSKVPTAIGVWDLSGVDEKDTKWIATVVLTKSEDGGLKGHIDWIGSNGSCGRELVVGNFDSESRVLTMNGKKVEFANRIVACGYRAELSKDHLSLENGKWANGTVAIPGSWSAKRIQLR